MVANAEPPLLAAYHNMPVPVADRLATVELVALQKLCVAVPVGAAGVVFIIVVTSSLLMLSQPVAIWLA